MDQDELKLICSLKTFPNVPTECPQLSVSEETFTIIKRQLKHRHFRSAQHHHRQDKQLKSYLARLDKGESIYQIAKDVNFSPCMMARILLENKYGWNKTTISNVFKQCMKEGEENEIEEEALLRRGLSTTELARIIREVRECIHEDLDCSPFADRIRHNMGIEYEYLLHETLRHRQLVFESEDMLREKGMSKTPDVILLLPIGVKDLKSGQLHVVNWIDSKAMFGDRHTHEKENANQLQGYVNRYGPGMVIYWFGYVAQIKSDSDILVTDSFPNEVVLPGGFNPLESVTKLQEGAEVKLKPIKIRTDFDDDWNPVTVVQDIAH